MSLILQSDSAPIDYISSLKKEKMMYILSIGWGISTVSKGFFSDEVDYDFYSW